MDNKNINEHPNNLFINEDHGTFFYKLRNGSMPFEYGVEDKLDNIHDILLVNNQDITCGLFSSIIANFLTSINDSFDNTVWFIIFLLSSYIVLKILVVLAIKGFKKFKKWKQTQETEPKHVVDKKIQEWFYKKIIVDAAYIFSVVNRSIDTTNKEDDKKYDLKKMYALQGKYEIHRICVEMNEVLISNKKKLYTINLIGDIGEEAFDYVISTLKESTEKLQTGPFKLDCSLENKKIEKLEGIGKEKQS